MNQIVLPKLFDLEKKSREPKFKNGFYQKDVLSVDQFDKESLSYIFTRAEEMAEMVDKIGTCDLLKGYIQACVFYEPSTRTSSSFIAAMERLGGEPSRSRRDQVLLSFQGREPGGYHVDP